MSIAGKKKRPSTPPVQTLLVDPGLTPGGRPKRATRKRVNYNEKELLKKKAQSSSSEEDGDDDEDDDDEEEKEESGDEENLNPNPEGTRHDISINPNKHRYHKISQCTAALGLH